MLPKSNRVDKKGIDLLFKQGKSLFSPVFTFKFLINPENQRKISFIAPKSVSKLAVNRNKLRRKGYNSLKNYINQAPNGILGVFVFKKYEDNLEKIAHEIKNILSKIH